jgi:multidrug efflux system membrane fusion protein
MMVMTIALIVVFGGLYGFNEWRKGLVATFLAGMKPPPAPVVAVIATEQSVPKFLTAIGTVAAVHQVTIAPEVAGRITQVFFKPGVPVRAGDPLIQINDQPDQGDLANFKAQQKYALQALRRSKELVVRQAAAQATVDQNQAAYDQAEASIAKTEAVIAQKQVRAPFDGELGIRQIELGQFVAAGAPVVTLTNLATLFVNFTLAEQTRGQVSVGQEVRITVDAYPDRSFVAKLSTIEPQISTDTRTMKLQATLDNPDHLLLPGMFANVKLVLPPQSGVVTLPATSVDFTLYGDAVFVVEDAKDAKGVPVLKVRRAFVKTGERFDDRVTILSGVKPGDRVTTSGQLKLLDGAAVVLSDTDTLVKPSTIPTN